MDVSNVTPLLADNADFEQFFIHGHYNYNSKISYILSDGTLHDFPLNNIITDMEVKDPDTNTLWARCHDFFCWAHFPTETAKKNSENQTFIGKTTRINPIWDFYFCDILKIFLKILSTFQKNSYTKNMKNTLQFVALDLETTGLDPKTDTIIEIAAIKFSLVFDGEKITIQNPEERNMLINP